MPYAIYGKRSKEWLNEETDELMPPDTTFKALDAEGRRVSKLSDAFAFATKEDAERYLFENNTHPRDGFILEVRYIK